MTAKIGRPTKLTETTLDLVCKLLRAGNFLETAAAAAGVSASTHREWLRRGERDASAGKSTVYARFWGEASQAMAQAEARDVALISSAASKDWRAAAWRLEHRHPDRWGPRQKVELTGVDGGPLQHDIRVAIMPLDVAREVAQDGPMRHSVALPAEGESDGDE